MKMCNCRFDNMERIRENMYPNADAVRLDQVEMLSGKTYSTASIKIYGNKKDKTINIFHVYCPFCGEKYLDK